MKAKIAITTNWRTTIMNTRILSTSHLVGPSLAALGEKFPKLSVLPFRSDAWNRDLEHTEALVVLLSEPLNKEDLKRCPSLRAIGTYSVGVNHLPIDVCRDRGISIVNTPGVLTDATADTALTLLLAVTRRVAEGEALVRSKTWPGWQPDQLLGIGLSGKTCGILGSGPIGRAFARRVWALGMNPIFWDRDSSGQPVDFSAAGNHSITTTAPRLPLKELLHQSAVLSLHCPLTDQTKGLLGSDELSLLPKGAVVVNTARGGILNEAALRDLLRRGHLGGVGLDVYEGEPRLHPDWLDTPRTVLLPHLGSATFESRSAMAELLCTGLERELSKQVSHL
jgi:glyoxylate reductase